MITISSPPPSIETHFLKMLMLDVRLLDFHGYKEGSQRRAFFVSNQITNN